MVGKLYIFPAIFSQLPSPYYSVSLSKRYKFGIYNLGILVLF